MKQNPHLICLFGPSGCGKTRLLQVMEETFPTKRVLHLGAESLVQDLLLASRQAKMTEHLEGYRRVENLLVDNLWVLAGKPATAAWIAEILLDRQAPGQLTVVASDLSIADWAGKSESIAELLVGGEKIWLAPLSPPYFAGETPPSIPPMK